ncbi:MAG: PEGA domain-containing protein [Thermodesulfobacteriota bacterium]|nr:PEGA domain-containing protein [Thermodesulfobacteriota bacterium]
MSRFFDIYIDGELHSYQEDDLPLIIGTDQHAHVRLPAGRAVVASIGLHNGGYLFLQAETGSDTVFHNDQLLKDSVWIKSGDVTRIADWILQYRISGDRVEIILAEQTGPAVPSGDQTTVQSPLHQNVHIPDTALPRVEEGQRKKTVHVKRNVAAGIAFLLLLLAAVFVLTARSIELTVEPEPDSMKLHGTVPVFQLGHQFLGIAGTYILEASKAGYQDLRTEVIVNKSGSSRYDFSMEKLPGLLEVSSTPAGAEVFLDGKSLGRTPVTDLEVSSGKHELRCILDRYREWQQEIIIQGQGMRQSLACELQPAWGRVFVVTDPAGATVREGDREIGLTPLTVELAQGGHTLLLQADGYIPFSLKVGVETGATLTPPVVTLELIPVQLALRSTPAGAKVSLNGKSQGNTPLKLSLAVGRSHLVHFSLVGYKSVEKTVTAREGENQELAVTLEAELGELVITVSPQGAQLFIDGKKQKKNSGTFKLPARTYSVEARADGYLSEKKTVTLAEDKKGTLDFKLQKKAGAASAKKPQVASIGQSSKGLTLIRIDSAVFQMGASRREPGRRANESEHQVEITRPFLMGVHEVSNGEYRKFRPRHRSGSIAGGVTLDGDLQPVINVRWQDAVRYCNWLSRQRGLRPFYREQGGSLVPVVPFTNGFRLPFEAEWALTARMAGRTRPDRYPWSGGFPPRKHNGNYADESARTILPMIIKGYYDGYPVTAPVESFPRNIAGLFDIGGNVSEWCHDYYSPNPASVAGRAIDPTGPKTGNYHVLRGSSWRDAAITELRLSYRGYSNKAKDSLGFRVARYAQ